MREEDRDWMAYIDDEVRAVCEAKGWGHQIRRKWSVREKPVSESPIEDYEWKLIPGAQGRLAEAPVGDFQGTYYVLYLEKPDGSFILQHDTSHEGCMGPHMEVATYTKISRVLWDHVTPEEHTDPHDQELVDRLRDRLLPGGRPPAGWLRDHLLGLIARFGPNNFSET